MRGVHREGNAVGIEGNAPLRPGAVVAIADQIFKPLGMKDSGVDHAETIIERRATGYATRNLGTRYDDTLINVIGADISWAFGGGDLYSTVEDLYKFDQALDSNQVISKSIVKLMFAPKHKANEEGSYGYGWWINPGDFRSSREVVAAQGALPGFITFLNRYSDSKTTLILLCNNSLGCTTLRNEMPKFQTIMFGSP